MCNVYICIYINIYIYRRANKIYIQKKLQHMDSLSLFLYILSNDINIQSRVRLMIDITYFTHSPCVGARYSDYPYNNKIMPNTYKETKDDINIIFWDRKKLYLQFSIFGA